MEEYDLIVAGAGISGLSLAVAAVEAGWRTRVFEAAPRPGGCVDTHRPVQAPGFWLELGAHTCFNSYGRLLDFAAVAGLEAARLSRRRLPFRLWQHGRSVSVAARLDPFGLLAGALRLPFLKRSGRTVEEYFGALAGRHNFRRVVGPALEAVACQPVAGFPAEYLFRAKPRRKDIPRSFTYSGGLGMLAEAMAAVSGLELTPNTPVQRIVQRGEGFSVFTAGQTHVARRLALAVSPPEAARLLAEVDPVLSAEVRRIGISEVESVGVSVRAVDTALPLVAGLIGAGQPFYSVVSRDVVPSEEMRGFTFHFRPGRLDEATQLTVMAEVLGTRVDRFVDVARTRHRLPALDRLHPERVAAIDARLRGRPLALAGNWFTGLSLEDCALRAASEVSRLASGGGAA